MTTPKGEDDVAGDPNVAASRAGEDSDNDEGEYVGRAGGDDALDNEKTGAEARSEQDGT